MPMKAGLMCAAAILALGGVAKARDLIAGPNYGGGPGGTINCRLFNAGTSRATVSVQVFDNLNNVVSPSVNTCSVLGVGQSCVWSAPITGNLAYSCQAFVPASIRGVSQIQDDYGGIAKSLFMQ